MRLLESRSSEHTNLTEIERDDDNEIITISLDFFTKLFNCFSCVDITKNLRDSENYDALSILEDFVFGLQISCSSKILELAEQFLSKYPVIDKVPKFQDIFPDYCSSPKEDHSLQLHVRIEKDKPTILINCISEIDCRRLIYFGSRYEPLAIYLTVDEYCDLLYYCIIRNHCYALFGPLDHKEVRATLGTGEFNNTLRLYYNDELNLNENESFAGWIFLTVSDSEIIRVKGLTFFESILLGYRFKSELFTDYLHAMEYKHFRISELKKRNGIKREEC